MGTTEDELYDFLSGKVNTKPPSNPGRVQGLITGKVTIPRQWDGDLEAQKRIGLNAVNLCLNYIARSVVRSGGNPYRGISLESVVEVPDDHPIRESDERLMDARYVLTVTWRGAELDGKKMGTMRTHANNDVRAERIRAYLDEIERERGDDNQ